MIKLISFWLHRENFCLHNIDKLLNFSEVFMAKYGKSNHRMVSMEMVWKVWRAIDFMVKLVWRLPEVFMEKTW